MIVLIYTTNQCGDSSFIMVATTPNKHLEVSSCPYHSSDLRTSLNLAAIITSVPLYMQVRKMLVKLVCILMASSTFYLLFIRPSSISISIFFNSQVTHQFVLRKSHSLQNAYKQSTKTESTVIIPGFKSWSKGVVTEITPSLRQNCTKLMNGDAMELERVNQLLNALNTFYINANFSNCAEISEEFYNNFYISESEKTFPVAYTLIVHTNAQQILRFLKTIYRPQNLYCIHPDTRSGPIFTETFKLISHCLPNVFVPSQVHGVDYYKPHTIFQAQMSCFKDLETHSHKWRYVINLCGRELPLKTNRHLVQSLRNMDGASVVSPYRIDDFRLKTTFSESVRFDTARRMKSTVSELTVKDFENNNDFLGRHSLKIYKSMAYNALSRPFVHYVLNDRTMQLFRQWIVKYCQTPEEFFYAMAFMMPGAPGGNSSRIPSSDKENITRVFQTHWKHDQKSHEYVPGETCLGKTVHEICILNSAELPRVYYAMKANHWFFNKYFMEEDHIVMDCVEEELIRRNRQEFAHGHLS